MTPNFLDQRTVFKREFPDAVILLEVGDFFEAFDDDAQTLADVAGAILTVRRYRGTDIPMAGFAAYRADHYANLLAAAGHRVVFGRIVASVEGRAIWEARTYAPDFTCS